MAEKHVEDCGNEPLPSFEASEMAAAATAAASILFGNIPRFEEDVSPALPLFSGERKHDDSLEQDSNENIEQTKPNEQRTDPKVTGTKPLSDLCRNKREIATAKQPKQTPRRRRDAARKKAPQAPKRFKSSYVLYSMARMEQISSKNQSTPGVGFAAASRQVAREWRDMSAKEKQIWKDLAERDKLRFLAEKRLYQGPWEVQSKRSRKDPSAPKRPMSAFLFFSQTYRQAVKHAHPNVTTNEISRLLGQKWRAAPIEERNKYIQKEAELRKKYHQDMMIWEQAKKGRDDMHEEIKLQIVEEALNDANFRNEICKGDKKNIAAQTFTNKDNNTVSCSSYSKRDSNSISINGIRQSNNASILLMLNSADSSTNSFAMGMNSNASNDMTVPQYSMRTTHSKHMGKPVVIPPCPPPNFY